MRKILNTAAALALAAAAFTTMGTSGAEAADGPWDGCPYGAVCIYPQDADTSRPPTDVFWSYGAHNLRNQNGWHWVLNNQSGGAHAHLCTGSNGTGCGEDLPAQTGVYADLTPINSITLDRP